MSEALPLAKLRVVSLRPQRRRAGFAFTREPVELSKEDLGGTEIEAIEAMLAIAEDPQLRAVFVQVDGTEQTLTAEEIDALRGFVEAVKVAQASSASSADAAALAAELLGGKTELQPASGASGYAEGDASTSGASAASSGEANVSATPVNSPGDASSSAEDAGQSRQAADEPAADRKAGEDEGNQPEETPVPPVAETEIGPSAAPAAGKPARKAKPKPATEATAS